MPLLPRPLAAACVIVALCAALRGIPAAGAMGETSPAPAAADDSGPLDLAAFLALPARGRADRVERSERWLAKWRKFEDNARRSAKLNDAKTAETITYGPSSPLNVGGSPQKWLGSGAVEAAQWLSSATDLDPSNAEAWLALARLRADLGERERQRAALAAAGRALDAAPDSTSDERRALRLEVLQASAWLDRDEGRWDEGLAVVERGLGLEPEDLELMLVKGLILADAGRFVEASAIARDLPSIRYHVHGMLLMGLQKAPSDYGSRWIQAMAYVAAGDPKLAEYALGVLHPERIRLPFMSRYWNDVGLVAELNDRPADAAFYYSIALVTAPWHYYRPWAGFGCPSRILGQPAPGVPVFTSPAHRYLAGSLFSYGAQIAAEAEVAADSAIAAGRGALADSALTLCRRRNVRPALALALRGELRADLGEDDLAEADLTRARQELAASGQRNARTSTALGIIRMKREDYTAALDLLREATQADSTSASAWRMLGVALAEVDRPVEARAAMDRAIALAPRSADGWYNRGVLALSRSEWEPAVADLRAAAALAPQSVRIAEALARAERQAPDTILTRTPGTIRRELLRVEPSAPERLPLRGATVGLGQTSRPSDRVGRLLEPTAAADSAAGPRLHDLESLYERQPSPQAREQLASAYLRARAPEKALKLLAPSWGKDLSVVETRIVLEADRQRNDAGRALDLARAVDPAHPDPADRDLWALVAMMCSGADHARDGLRALEAALTLDPRNSGLIMYRETLRAQAGK